jgi:hypothetical protein
MNFFIRRPRPTEWHMCKDSRDRPRCTFYGLSRDQWVFNLACDAPIYTFIGFYIFLSLFWQLNQSVQVLGGRFNETDQMIWLAVVCGACVAPLLYMIPGLVWAIIFVYSMLNLWLDDVLEGRFSRDGKCTDPICFWGRVAVIGGLTIVMLFVLLCACSCMSDKLVVIHRPLGVGYSLSLSTALQVDGIDDHFSDGWTHTAILFGCLILGIIVAKFIYDKWVVGLIYNTLGDNMNPKWRCLKAACFPCLCAYKYDRDHPLASQASDKEERKPIMQRSEVEVYTIEEQ